MRSWFDILVVDASAIGWLLWVLSFVTIGIIVMLFLQIRRGNLLPEIVREQLRALFEQRQYREAIDLTANQPDYLSHVMHSALVEAPHGYAAMERAMEEAGEERATHLLRKIEWLNLIGNISPMMGLLGTVWGMIGAFFAIVEEGGTPSPDAFAAPIGLALVTTLLGLAIAIPSLTVYAVMRSRIDSLSSEALLTSQEFISTFRPSPSGARRPATPPAVKPSGAVQPLPQA